MQNLVKWIGEKRWMRFLIKNAQEKKFIRLK